MPRRTSTLVENVRTSYSTKLMSELFKILWSLRDSKKKTVQWVVFPALFFVSGCQTASVVEPSGLDAIKFDIPKWLEVEKMAQNVASLGRDFYDVTITYDSGTGSYSYAEQVGYIFFKDKRICRCSRKNTTMSPDGQYIVYVNEKASLELYDVMNDKIMTLSDTFVGYPKAANWKISDRTVLLSLEKGWRNITDQFYRF